MVRWRERDDVPFLKTIPHAFPCARSLPPSTGFVSSKAVGADLDWIAPTFAPAVFASTSGVSGWGLTDEYLSFVRVMRYSREASLRGWTRERCPDLGRMERSWGSLCGPAIVRNPMFCVNVLVVLVFSYAIPCSAMMR